VNEPTRDATVGPLVSIGLPVYNGARSLERALGDLCRQDYRNLEIIVSDNGSTDDSVAIARRVAAADPRVRVFAEPTNRGAIWNFNRVFELSRGEFFMWAAHDDRRHHSYISRCLPSLLADPDVAICHTRIAIIDGEGRVLRIDARPFSAVDDSPRRRFARAVSPPQWTMPLYGLIRRAHLSRTHGIRNYYGSDLGLVVELALYGKIVQLDDALFSYCEAPPQDLGSYVARTLSSLSPDNRYRPWLPVRVILAGQLLALVRRFPAPAAEKALMVGDVMRHLAVSAPQDVLRMAVAAIGPANYARLRGLKRRLVSSS
jgi:glycosyltransferase involved in cell wall biosynthesis